MKKHFFKIISLSLILSLLFSSFVFASNVSSGAGKHFHSKQGAQAWFTYSYESIMSLLFGVVCKDPSAFYNIVVDTIKRDKLHDDYISNGGDEWAWLYDRIEVDDPDDPQTFTFDDELIAVLRDGVETYKAKCDSDSAYEYKQTFTPTLNSDSFSNYRRFSNALNQIKSLCNQYDYVLAVAPPYNRGYGTDDIRFLACLGMSVSQCGFVKGSGDPLCYIEWVQPTYYYPSDDSWGNVPVYIMDLETGLKYNFSSLYSLHKNGKDVIPGWIENAYEQNPRSVICLETETPVQHKGQYSYYLYCSYFGVARFNTVGASGIFYPDISGHSCVFSKDGKYIPVYKSLNDLKRFNTGTVDYPYFTFDPPVTGNTITAGQLNNGVNYGDIIGGNKYVIIPGPGNPIQLPGPGSGGGGGGGGTDPTPDPGGGGGTSPGWNWDFSGLLKGLVSLIQAIFGLITSIIGEIATQLANLIKSINTILTSIKELFNTSVMQLLSEILIFLPSDVLNIIRLVFVLGAVVGIYKLIRG